MRRLLGTVACLAAAGLSGCASIELNAVIDQVCKPPAAAMSPAVAAPGLRLARADAEVAAAARARLPAGARAPAPSMDKSLAQGTPGVQATLGMRLLRDGPIVALGLEPPGARDPGGEKPPRTDHISWMAEYKGVRVLPDAMVREVPKAMEQVERMASLMQIVDGKVISIKPSTDTELLGAVNETLASGGYDGLAFDTYSRLFGAAAQNVPDSNGDVRKDSQLHEVSRFISTYFRAYFRGGGALQVSLNTEDISANAAEEAARVAGQAGQSMTDANKKKVADSVEQYLKKLCRGDGSGDDCLLTRSLGNDSFVSRSGMSVQFSGVVASLGDGGKVAAKITYPKVEEVGPQIVRVMTEAAFDSYPPYVPAVANSTACVKGLYSGSECLSANTSATRAGRVKFVDTQSNKVEGFVTTSAGKLIRGLSIAALNNEALAKSLETLAGVVSRKTTEKAAWALIEKECPPVDGTVVVKVTK